MPTRRALLALLSCSPLLVRVHDAGAASQPGQRPVSTRDWQALRQLSGIAIGDMNTFATTVGARPTDAREFQFVVFFDPNCPHCADLWFKVRACAQTKLKEWWLPVAYLRPDSLPRAAAILQAFKPAQALADNFDHFDHNAPHGGIGPLVSPESLTVGDIKRNSARWNSMGGATPLTVYRDPLAGPVAQIGVPPLFGVRQMLRIAAAP